MNLLRILQLLLAKNAFLRAELEHIERRKKLGEAYGDIKEFEPEAASRIEKKRRGLMHSFVYVFLLLVAGALTAGFINTIISLSLYWIRIVRAISVLLIAWAVLSRLGYEVPTMKGGTLLEITNISTFNLFYSLGLYIGGVSLFLEPE